MTCTFCLGLKHLSVTYTLFIIFLKSNGHKIYKLTVLKNYLINFNEIYTAYQVGYIEFKYQLSSHSKNLSEYWKFQF